VASLQSPDGKRYELKADHVRIGRDRINDIALADDPKVSRSHAEIQMRGSQRFLVDLKSRNGTIVNNRRLSVHPLCDGDHIRLGDTTLTYLAGLDANATEVATEVDMAARPDLSERELGILVLVAQGLTDRDIGDRLAIAASTVRSHLDRIKTKTGLRRRSELTRLAIELELPD
jgi:pSer/pThr/pTyr-binding forkhead associated (FHA) protein